MNFELVIVSIIFTFIFYIIYENREKPFRNFSITAIIFAVYLFFRTNIFEFLIENYIYIIPSIILYIIIGFSIVATHWVYVLRERKKYIKEVVKPEFIKNNLDFNLKYFKDNDLSILKELKEGNIPENLKYSWESYLRMGNVVPKAEDHLDEFSINILLWPFLLLDKVMVLQYKISSNSFRNMIKFIYKKFERKILGNIKEL